MIQSQNLLFSTFPQATQMHKLSPYSPGAGTLQYTSQLKILTVPSQSNVQTNECNLMDMEDSVDMVQKRHNHSAGMHKNAQGRPRAQEGVRVPLRVWRHGAG